MITYILTGGTIGSSIGADGIAHPDADLSALIGTDAKVRIPYNIQSENLDGKHINILIKETAEVLKEGLSEGIIITHGSDTLQYTAAMLDNIFGGAGIPIVLVAANYVLTDARSNGKANLYFSQRFIKERRGSGVFVCYKNDGEAVKIHRGSALLPHEPFSDRLRSVNDKCFGYYSDNEDMETAGYVQTASPEDRKAYDGIVPRLIGDPGCILRIEPYPGMAYPEIGDKVKAVLLGSYHSGTIGISEELGSFMGQARERAVSVYLCGIARNGTEYESISAYEELGIIPIYDISPINAYCILWLKGGAF